MGVEQCQQHVCLPPTTKALGVNVGPSAMSAFWYGLVSCSQVPVTDGFRRRWMVACSCVTPFRYQRSLLLSST
jgi:hypothetical protein